MIRHSVPARVGILGNPSDGYGGRTIGLAVDEFAATVSLRASSSVIIKPGSGDRSRWSSTAALADDIDAHGYGTGVQLLTAAVRTFVDVAASVGEKRIDGFELSYETTIPRQVGLAGSSALVIGALRCLSEHTGILIPDDVLPSIGLKVETEQLGITAGLQDRVVQVFGGLVSMDFGDLTTEPRFGVAHGDYEQLDPDGLPPLFLAFRPSASAPSGSYHGDLRSRFDSGDPMVRETMRALAGIASEGRAALRWGAGDQFAQLIGKNMDLRRRLGPLPEDQLALADLAESMDAPATFTGSGGAIVGSQRDGEHLDALRAAFAGIEAEVIELVT